MTLGLEDNSSIPTFLTGSSGYCTDPQSSREQLLSPCSAPGNMPRAAVIYSRQDYKIATKPQDQVTSGKTLGMFSTRLRNPTEVGFFLCHLQDSRHQCHFPSSAAFKQKPPISSVFWAFFVFCPQAGISLSETHNLLRGFVGSLSINDEKRRTPRKKSNSINLHDARFTNKYFIWGKKYKAVIPITKIMNAK